MRSFAWETRIGKRLGGSHPRAATLLMQVAETHKKYEITRLPKHTQNRKSPGYRKTQKIRNHKVAETHTKINPEVIKMQKTIY